MESKLLDQIDCLFAEYENIPERSQYVGLGAALDCPDPAPALSHASLPDCVEPQF